MLYFFLIETINRVLKGEEKVHKFFNVTNGKDRIVVLLTTEFCLIYDDHFDQKMISYLSDELEFSKFIRYYFAGSKKTIDELFALNSAEYEMQKHRIIYKCSAVSLDFKYAPGSLQMGDINRIQELTRLSEEFAEEYFEGKKEPENMKRIITAAILGDSIYQWVDKGEIRSIAQSMNEDFDFPVIGHFYTHRSFRNMGYGASIVHALTKGLLGEGHPYIMLSTNALTPSSNRVFGKVGYTNTGEYLLAYKNKS
jgi:FR47-like protein